LLSLLFVKRPRNWIPESVFMTAVALRIIGSTARYQVLFLFYGGGSDAMVYYHDGLLYREMALHSGLSFLSPDFWFGLSTTGGRWYGTPFMQKLSGLVLSFIGPTIRGEFLFFSVLSFTGLYLIAAAFKLYQPLDNAIQYCRWIWFFPTLWFWPSSVGKEAVTIFAIGLITYGYAAKTYLIRWPIFLMGMGLTYCIRPHITLVLGLATVTAHWLGSWRGISLRRIVEGLLLLMITFWAFKGMTTLFGLDNPDMEGVQEYFSFRAGKTESGGSRIGATPLSLLGIPIAFIKIWMRPFPWEVHNVTAALAALEILILMRLMWRRRSVIRHSLVNWRSHTLLRFAVPLFVFYTIMIGLAFSNLGIIARQRAPILPFLLMIMLTETRREQDSANFELKQKQDNNIGELHDFKNPLLSKTSLEKHDQKYWTGMQLDGDDVDFEGLWEDD
ncbi:hypothetical protein ACFL27_27200, partial [candidate division CSSED10-310 bacterium]